MWDKLSDIEKFGLIFIFMGSVVDLFQFMWLVRNWIKKAKKSIHDRIKKEILLEHYNFEKHFNEQEKPDYSSQGAYGKDGFPDLKGLKDET